MDFEDEDANGDCGGGCCGEADDEDNDSFEREFSVSSLTVSESVSPTTNRWAARCKESRDIKALALRRIVFVVAALQEGPFFTDLFAVFLLLLPIIERVVV